MRVLAIAAILISVPAHGQTCDQAGRDARMAIAAGAAQCIREQSASLERSRETAESIATAALVACQKHLSAIRAGCGGMTFADVMDKRLRDLAVSEVVKIRASRP